MSVSFCFPLHSFGYRLDDLGFDSWQEQEIFLFFCGELGYTQHLFDEYGDYLVTFKAAGAQN